MDVLLGSIDVRDLLSTPDLDDASSPLSAPDLRLLMDRLQIRSARIQDQARAYVLSHRRDFAALLSRCARASAASSELSATLSSAFGLLSDRPLDLEIRTLVHDFQAARSELAERREALAVVSSISELVGRLRAARDGLRAGRVLKAAGALRELKDGLLVSEGVDGREENEPKVFGLMRKEWSECFDELQGVLAKNVEGSVKFELEKGRVRVWSSSSNWDANHVGLNVALQALEILDAVDYGMGKVADLMIKHVMLPAISDRSIAVSIEEHNQDEVENPESVLCIVPSSDVQDYQDGSTLYLKLVEIIKFIQKFICLENSTWMRCFGKLTWSRISDMIITYFLSKAVPDDASKLDNFQDIMRNTTGFEANLREMMFISADRQDEKLSRFVHDVEVHFAARKRSEILVKARNTLLQYDYTKPPQASGAVGNSSEHLAELLFQSERCVISGSASQLMKLVHEALKDASLSSTRVAKEFYNAARDALLLYKAVVPVKLEKHFDSVSQVAIIIHNDLSYLSQEILGLAFEYRADFPSGLQKHAIFVDLASNFRLMAEEILQRQIQQVVVSLKEAIDGADGFQNTHQSQQYESAKFGIDQVVFILEKVHIMWESIMPSSAYIKSMRTILDFIFSRITKDMLLLDDMAAEETLQLQGLIHLALENLSSLFGSLVTNEEGKGKFMNHRSWVQLEEMVPSLRKFRRLADLFDMPLKSITEAWENGELVDCGFTSSEVENFIKAIFADSPLRKECLRRIEYGNT